MQITLRRRTRIRIVLLLLIGPLPAVLAVATSAVAQEPIEASEGMVAYRSNAPFDETLERVEAAVRSRDLFVMRILDHSESAALMGRSLAPNSVVLFGNPRIGSQVMTCSPRVGIDLPNKLLVWEETGAVFVAYNDPAYLVRRHSIRGCDEVLKQVSKNLEGIAREVAAGTG